MKSKKFNLMLITNCDKIAEYASNSGVSRIFIDLEINGKNDRQGHLDTVISRHSMSDIDRVKKVVSNSEVLVRINPFFSGTKDEVDHAIERGADILMLPMFTNSEEIKRTAGYIDGRVKFIPLVETAKACLNLDEIIKADGISELFFGLNDLHRDLGMKFMFEPLLNGYLEQYTAKVLSGNLPFGFGGVARVGTGVLPAELILSEHSRLGSSNVILSRDFHNRATNLDEMKMANLQLEVKKILNAIDCNNARDDESIKVDKSKLDSAILNIMNG